LGGFLTGPICKTYFSVADFSSNVTSGYAPLPLQFTDLLKYATGGTCNFGDGTSSTQMEQIQNPE
jgi:PKD repeat protein